MRDIGLPKRKSTRLKGYDYSTEGAYFITICVQDRRNILSEIIVGEGLAPPEVQLTETGRLAEEQLRQLSVRYPTATVDRYVIMPNHIHFILRLRDRAGRASPSPTVVQVVGAFKSMTTRLCPGKSKLFQRSFYDHVIRGEEDYQEIWSYIDQNPAKWREDRFYISETDQEK